MIEILNTETDYSGDIEMTIRVPEFHNFGQRMAEIERAACDGTAGKIDSFDGDSDHSEFDEYDLELLNVVLSEDVPWDDEVQTNLDLFFAEWTGLRPILLEETFHYYLDNHKKFVAAHRDREGLELLLPSPEKPKVIVNLFRITSIHLWEDGTIGLGGYCTWDEEHGYGAVIRDGEVLKVGRESDALE